MKFLLISPKNRTVYNFRGELIKKIINLGYEVVVIGPDMTDVGKINELGARFIELPFNKNGTSIVSDIKYCLSLKRILRSEKPDVTLGYTIKPVVYGSIAAKLAHVKNINSMVTGGGYTFTSTSIKARVLGLIVRLLYRIGFTCADHVIFQNPDDMREFSEKRLVKSSKCSFVNGSGVDISKFRPTDFPDTVSFFMLSRLLKSKGVEEYLNAADIVKKEYPEIQFYLLGKYENSMQDAVSKSLVEDYISRGVVVRYDESDNVIPYYEACSVYVLPSYREGTPRTVLEAMACGRPIITTDTQGCRETVIDGKNGYLVPVKNSEAIAEKMKVFINNPDLISKMGNSSRSYVEEKFDVNKVNEQMIEIMKM